MNTIDDIIAEALIALVKLDAARIYANAVHADLLAHGAPGLHQDPNSQSLEEIKLRKFLNGESL